MKARTLDPDVKVFSSTDANSVSIATLPAGTEIEFGPAKRKDGKLWVPITLTTGQQAFIPGETRIHIIQMGSLLQNNVELRAEPRTGSLIKQQLARNTRVYILQVIKGTENDWVKVRDMSGLEGYIPGGTRIKVLQQQTKSMGMRSIRSGAMWIIAGLVIIFSNSAPTTGSVYYMFGYGAILFGAIMLIMGFIQYRKAPS